MVAETYSCCYWVLPTGVGLPQVLQAALMLQLGQQRVIAVKLQLDSKYDSTVSWQLLAYSSFHMSKSLNGHCIQAIPLSKLQFSAASCKFVWQLHFSHAVGTDTCTSLQLKPSLSF